MAKANVGKFYEKLAQDAALAEKLNEMDKKFVDTNEGSADDIAMREKAVEAIILPLAQEVGLPFTLDELKEYEREQLKELNLSEDELEQVAGGVPKNTNSRNGVNACAYIGVGFGRTKKDGKIAFCILFGGSNGPAAG